ncbi:MAG: App1 family protein [Corynebacterium flavescens]|uniref:App1 family protein n=1 Tax=Corynebacterium flavescens TaxID=28028 RepID=UPI003F927679
MGIADIARKAEKALNTTVLRRSARRGWVPQVLGYMGYGNSESVHVLARVLMHNPHDDSEEGKDTGWAQRGYRQFLTIQVPNLPVEVTVGACTVRGRTDANGYIDIMARHHGLESGWHKARIEVRGAQPIETQVLIVDPATPVGIVSDVDDTVLVTWLPRALTAAWNSWVKKTDTRQPVREMAVFYAHLRRTYPEAPFFYLSTGAWNTYDALVRFLRHHGFPLGPMLLTDWGPTPTGLFRNGQEHKRVQLRNLFITYPNTRWILIGDDGQHDPLTYADAATEHPDRVLCVAIRNLSAQEQILSHGSPTPLAHVGPERYFDIPLIQGADGSELAAAFRSRIEGEYPNNTAGKGRR